MSNRIHKKHKHNNFKTSDRRLASGSKAESFLLGKNSVGNVNVVKTNIAKGKTTTPEGKVFKLFVGNLGKDATEDVVRTSFQNFTSLCSVEVPMSNGENRGFAFVGFNNSGDYLEAFKTMNGKYVGHHPCVLKRAK